MVITFFNQKGGVGKTTSCFLLSDYLASKNKKILLMDLDPQGTLTSTFLEEPNTTLWDFFQKTKTLNQILVKIDEKRDLLPASIFMTRSGEIDSSALLLEKLYFDKLMKDYDVVLIDCPPNLGTFSRLGLLLADKLFMPVEATKQSYDALEDALKSISTLSNLNPNLKDLIVFQNRSQKRIAIKKTYEELFKSDLKDKWLDLSMPNSTQVQERATTGVNFFDNYKNEEMVNFFRALEGFIYG